MANVPIQSLIDHIKTAIDVDPWAKEMAEELLKEREPVESKTGKWITRLRHEHYPSGKPYEEDFCSECGKRGSLEYPFCPWCGKKMESGEVG